MKKIGIILLIISLIFGIVAYIIFSNPLRKSENEIRDQMLELTPIGSKMDDVVTLIKSKRNWDLDYISHKHGFTQQGSVPEKTIGVKSIRVLIGEYSNPFTTSVDVFYGFDENSELIDIWVWKTVDSL